MTNGDKIRKMTDEELVAFMICPYGFEADDFCVNDEDCNDCVKGWLESEAEE